MNQEISKMDPIAVSPLIRDYIEKKDYPLAFLIYMNKEKDFDRDDKIDALNMFAVILDTMLGSNMNTLSNLAAIFNNEPPFKEEYEKVCKHIQDRLLLTQGC